MGIIGKLVKKAGKVVATEVSKIGAEVYSSASKKVGEKASETVENLFRNREEREPAKRSKKAKLSSAPPPVPTSGMYVAVSGQARGPFDVATLAQMNATGQLLGDSLVWRNGMSEWVRADSIPELRSLFVSKTPPIPESTVTFHADISFCAGCGAKIGKMSRFCPVCGMQQS